MQPKSSVLFHSITFYTHLFAEVTLNSQPVKPQEELRCRAGQCLQLGISVCNFLERSLRQVCLAVQFYQDHQNGVNNYRLETRLASAGASKVLLPEVGNTFLLLMDQCVMKQCFFYSKSLHLFCDVPSWLLPAYALGQECIYDAQETVQDNDPWQMALNSLTCDPRPYGRPGVSLSCGSEGNSMWEPPHWIQSYE